MQDLAKHDGPWLATILPQNKIEKGIIPEGFGVKLTFEAKHSRKLTRVYNPC
jgi:hypothetical protein